jgi:hypothetical protein
MLYKLNAEGITPHIVINMPINEEGKEYRYYYRGPDLEIHLGMEKIKIGSIAHLSLNQLRQFMFDSSKVYCKVMDVDYGDAAKEFF